MQLILILNCGQRSNGLRSSFLWSIVFVWNGLNYLKLWVRLRSRIAENKRDKVANPNFNRIVKWNLLIRRLCMYMFLIAYYCPLLLWIIGGFSGFVSCQLEIYCCQVVKISLSAAVGCFRLASVNGLIGIIRVKTIKIEILLEFKLKWYFFISAEMLA